MSKYYTKAERSFLALSDFSVNDNYEFASVNTDCTVLVFSRFSYVLKTFSNEPELCGECFVQTLTLYSYAHTKKEKKKSVMDEDVRNLKKTLWKRSENVMCLLGGDGSIGIHQWFPRIRLH